MVSQFLDWLIRRKVTDNESENWDSMHDFWEFTYLVTYLSYRTRQEGMSFAWGMVKTATGKYGDKL